MKLYVISSVFGLTRVGVESVSALPQSGAAVITAETTAMEELALGASSLQNVQMLLAEITELTATRL